VSRRYTVGLVVLLGALYVPLTVGALEHGLGLVLFCSLALYLVDFLLRRTEDEAILGGLGRIGAGSSWRFFYRELLVMVFLLRTGALTHTEQIIVVVMVLGHHVAHVLYSGLRLFVNYGRTRQYESRNLGVPGERLPAPLPDWLMIRGTDVVLHTDLLLTAALAWAFFGHTYTPVTPCAVAMTAAAVAVSCLLLPQAIQLFRLPGDGPRLKAAKAAIAKLEPRVVLYFSGDPEAVYQVNMWLETMERLQRSALVVLRERKYFDDVAATTVPMLCIPSSVDFMNFPLPTVRVALYVSNVGKNIHLLRLPTIKSAFIGHGDSDKTASFNPFAKVYDEVWVAGEAGRERYVRANVGVRPEEIVVVGRPQLDRIQGPRSRSADDPFTVLYAPTWEGWTDDPHHTSLVSMGREIVATLLATPGVRVIYKPHPLTGTVKKAAAQASRDIADMLLSAGPHHETVLTGRDLYDCFNDSDALVSDISSVVSDYLKSEKPYFVTNSADVPEAQFRDRNPSARGAYLVGSGATGLSQGLADVRGADSMREMRRRTRTYLLGDPETDAMTLFRKAVDDLTAKAEAYRPVAGAAVAAADDDELRGQRSAARSDEASAEVAT
jgi:hypothetical protein